MQETAKQPVGRGDHSSKRANAVESVFFLGLFRRTGGAGEDSGVAEWKLVGWLG